MVFPVNLITLITEAGHDAWKQAVALVACGVFLCSSALALIFKVAPGSVFVHWWQGSSAVVYAYYSVLAYTVVFGLAEASLGFWVVPRDVQGWSRVGKVVLFLSIFPLIVVLALIAGFKL
ncbi:hypothetical protein BAE44_0016418 [Dichanthelium oligosanthes]|uniref:Uncharacterized protein n=1 Tax=Dichanthelium oligosanthes TaxID=888268 RepID=A0A1E5VBN3_9POAL|nr:hypothetical protein BAE44_0016418 [Dichanthelium oligosanthes]